MRKYKVGSKCWLSANAGGSAIAPNSYYRSTSQKAMQKAIVRFGQLYGGELVVVIANDRRSQTTVVL
jgi:hypothetical protein